MHKPWINLEATNSYTWREIRAIQLFLLAFSKMLKESSVTFYTDSQNAASIVLKGHTIPELQTLALSIYNVCRQYSIVYTQFASLGVKLHRQIFLVVLKKLMTGKPPLISFEFLTKYWTYTVRKVLQM